MRPWRSNEERLVDESLERQQMAPEQVRASYDTRNLFPPRTGYGDRVERIPTIIDCFQMGHEEPDARYNFSGTPTGGNSGDLAAHTNPLG